MYNTFTAKRATQRRAARLSHEREDVVEADVAAVRAEDEGLRRHARLLDAVVMGVGLGVQDAEREAHLGLDVLGALGLDELADNRARVGAGPVPSRRAPRPS